jgi:hypothetical protein
MSTSYEVARRDHETIGVAREQNRRSPWVLPGVASGVVGAAVIALFFFAVDLAEGHPLHTPTALGSVFFKGELLAPDASADPPLVLAYTLMHGALFVAVGLLASQALASMERRRPVDGLTLAGLLFAGIEIAFVAVVALFGDGLVQMLGFVRIMAANLLAAGSMAAWLVSFVPPPHEATEFEASS